MKVDLIIDKGLMLVTMPIDPSIISDPKNIPPSEDRDWNFLKRLADICAAKGLSLLLVTPHVRQGQKHYKRGQRGYAHNCISRLFKEPEGGYRRRYKKVDAYVVSFERTYEEE
jgi:hypothetical protein